jgi:hypothetical protein
MESSIHEREREKEEQERILKELAEKKQQKTLVINQSNTSNVQESHEDMKLSHKKFNLDKEKLVLNDVLDFINKL